MIGSLSLTELRSHRARGRSTNKRTGEMGNEILPVVELGYGATVEKTSSPDEQGL